MALRVPIVLLYGCIDISYDQLLNLVTDNANGNAVTIEMPGRYFI